MSKGKKTPKPSSTADLSNWDDALIKDQLGSGEWKPCVVIVNPENCAADAQLQLLQQTVSSGVRKRFTVIAKEPLLASARDDLKESSASTGGKKSKQAKNAPAGAEKPAHLVVCEHTVQALDAGEVPASLVARMVKYKLLRMEKKEMQQRAEAKAAEEASKNPSAKGKGGASKGGKNTSASGKKGGKGGGKETPSTKETPEQVIPVPQKEPTKLRKRGEEDTALQTIDDEPTDGPDAYFILMGFDEAEVLEQLDVINVAVMLMVKLSAKDKGPPSAASEEEVEAYNKKNSKLSAFWKQLGRVTSTNNEESMLINMSCNGLTLPAAIPSGDEQKAQYGSEAFDKLAHMIYNTLDQYGMYQRYLLYTDYNKLTLQPSRTATTTEAASSEPPSRVITPLLSATSPVQAVDMTYYNKLLSHVPEDHTTVELILHCMVEQVSVKCSGEDVMARLMEPVNGVELGLSNHMSSLINGLALCDTHATTLNGTSPTTPAHMIQKKRNKISSPIILSNGDYISMCCYGLKDVGYFNISESARSMSQLSLFHDLMQQKSCTESSNDFAAERHAIQHHCVTGDLTQQSFYHYLFCLCFEQLALHCDCGVTGSEDPVLFQFDIPLQFATRLKDEGTLVAVDDVDTVPTLPPATATASPTSASTLDVPASLWDMSQYEVLALYDLPILLQLVQHLYYQYPFIVIGRHQLTDCLLLAMHNGHNGRLLQEHVDSSQLHCKVGFSKFLTYVWNKFGEDICKAAEEDDERKKQFELQKEEEIAAMMKVIEEELKSKEEEQLPKSAVKGKGNSGKKSSVAQKPTTAKQDSTELKEEDERIVEIRSRQFPERKLYVGYEVDNRVLLMDHLTAIMYPLDGSQVRVKQRKTAERDTTLDVCLLSQQSLLTCKLTISSSSIKHEQQSAKPTRGTAVLIRPKFPVKEGSFFASLDNGCLTLSTSCYGPFANGQVAITTDGTAGTTAKETGQSDSTGAGGVQPSPRPGSRGQSPGRKISKKDLEMQEKLIQEQQRLAEEKKEKDRLERERQRQEKLLTEQRQNKYLPLFISQSNGLQVQCKVVIDLECDPSLTDGSDGQFVIRQSYPTSMDIADGNVKLRSIMSNGEVIKCFSDGSVEILTADGRIMKIASESEKNLMTSASEQLDHVGEMESATKVTFKDSELLPPVADLPSPDEAVWMITLPTGERYLWKKVKVVKEEPPVEQEIEDGQNVASVSAQGSRENEKQPDEPSNPTPVTEQQQQPVEELYKPVVVHLEQLDSYTATDPVTKEVLVTKIDNTLLLTRPDGTLIVDYSDGTRFTSHYNDQHQLTDWTMECRGYARTSWDIESRTVSLEFDNGSDVTCHTDGHYDINTSNGTTLHLATDGSASYHHADGVTYHMDHSGNNDILAATDTFGNKFIVNSTGVAAVESSMDEEMIRAELHRAHPPQYFVIPPDNTAYQLLRNDDISVAMATAQSHPQGAVVAKGNRTTVMMPFEQDCTKRSPYKETSIIPPNLQPFTITTPTTSQSSSTTTKKKFGSTVGKGLMIGTYQPPPKPREVSVPSAIIVNQYLHHPAMSELVRAEIYRGLAHYIEWRDKQDSELQALKPIDDRSKEECDRADKLISLYSDQVNSSSATITDDYLTAINPPVEVQEQRPVSRGTPQQLVSLQKELAESAEAKQALRDKVVPPYFKSTQGRKFLMSNPPDTTALSSKVPKGSKAHVSFQQDNRARSPSEMELAVLKEDSRLSTPATNSINMAAASGIESPTQSELDKQVASASRPMNPTPSHASGQGTPTAIRPLNPTPLQATATPLGVNNDSASMLSIPMGANRPHNPTPARARQIDSRESSYAGPLPHTSVAKMETMSFHMEESSDGQQAELPMQKVAVNRSTYFNLTGEMRDKPVQIPSFIKGARPGEVPNEKFRTVEEPVRRKVATSSVARKQERRGFVLIPEEVVFGVLKEGCSYDITVALRNTGVDSCRYKIKQPPPSTGLRVHYTPGPVAAGMKAEIKVEIFAMAIGASSSNGVGTVEHLLEVTTETSILHLPIQAIVLTANSYQNRKPIHPQGGPGRNVRLLTEKPMSRDDVTRPSAKPNN